MNSIKMSVENAKEEPDQTLNLEDAYKNLIYNNQS